MTLLYFPMRLLCPSVREAIGASPLAGLQGTKKNKQKRRNLSLRLIVLRALRRPQDAALNFHS
jgi:hypothetical protein